MITTQRKAFSMLTAIVVIVTMSVLTMYVMGTAGKSIKITTDQYRKEQAMLLAKSYTEYAIMAITADATRVAGNNCLENIDANVGGIAAEAGINTAANPRVGYRVRIRISYIGDNRINGVCAATRVLSSAVGYTRTPLTAIIDAYVDYRDINSRNMRQVLTYHRRSLQKI